MSRRILQQSTRSTLYQCDDGTIDRKYHDTGRWESGMIRSQEDDKHTQEGGARPTPPLFRGEDPRSSIQVLPLHLQRARAMLVDQKMGVEHAARTCGVATTTMWSYAALLADRCPQDKEVLSWLVFPSLQDALLQVDSKGSLKEVMQRLEQTTSLRGDTDWRCTPHRWSHLRLARIVFSHQNPKE